MEKFYKNKVILYILVLIVCTIIYLLQNKNFYFIDYFWFIFKIYIVVQLIILFKPAFSDVYKELKRKDKK